MQTLRNVEEDQFAKRRLAIHAIEDGLSILGRSGQAAILRIIEADTGLTPDKLPDYPVTLIKVLLDVFGPGATPLLHAMALELRRTRTENEAQAGYLTELAIILDESCRSSQSISSS